MAAKTKAAKNIAHPAPEPERPTMPSGYGIAKGPKGQMAWSVVERQLTKAKNYWVGTTRPDGRPHVMPVWGLWVEGVFYFSSDGTSRKARNIAANPWAVVHLESGDDAVIVEGAAQRVRDKALLARVDAAYKTKYRMGLRGIPGDVGVFMVRPKVVFAWRERDFPKSATRWRF
jgi:PPOX class probable F420-dependent enzyme